MQHAPLHLNRSGGAADPAVVLVDQAAQPEGAPCLFQVAMQVAYGDDARYRRQDGAPRRLSQHGSTSPTSAAHPSALFLP